MNFSLLLYKQGEWWQVILQKFPLSAEDVKIEEVISMTNM